ncbi:MAG: prepilin-type N-terminal cleavage/methylation domain-containing protein [Candidatus Paceibacterota bacterium]
MKYFKQKQNKGFLLVEVLISVFIISVSVVSFSGLAQKAIAISRQSLNTTKASFFLEEGVEIVRAFRDSSWSNITSLSVNTDYYIEYDTSHNGWYFTTTPNTIDGFTRKITFFNVNRNTTTQDIDTGGVNDNGTKLVVVTVSWQEGASLKTKSVSVYISDIFS